MRTLFSLVLVLIGVSCLGQEPEPQVVDLSVHEAEGMDAFHVSVWLTGPRTPATTKKIRQFVADIRRSGPPGDGTAVSASDLIEGKAPKEKVIKLTQKAGPLVALQSGETVLLGKTLPQLRRVVWATDDIVEVTFVGEPTARYLAWVIESLHRNILEYGEWKLVRTDYQSRSTEVILTRVSR
jgi:hypothetical protein